MSSNFKRIVMRLLKLLLVITCFSIISCETSQETIDSREALATSKEFENPEIRNYVKNRINFTLEERGEELSTIDSYLKINDDLLVDYTLINGQSSNMLLQAVYDTNSRFLFPSAGANLSCVGDCGKCHLVYQIHLDKVTCTGCSDCAMVYSNFYLMDISSSNTRDIIENLEEIAETSYENTFKESATSLKLDGIEELKGSNGYIAYRVSYSSNENSSSYMLSAQLVGNIFNNKKTIDCYGDCGCKEEFYPSTGKISCSCNDCKMDITEQDELNFSLMPYAMHQIN